MKYEYYNSRNFMNDYEKTTLNNIQIGMILSEQQSQMSLIGGILAYLPNIKIGVPTSMEQHGEEIMLLPQLMR